MVGSSLLAVHSPWDDLGLGRWCPQIRAGLSGLNLQSVTILHQSLRGSCCSVGVMPQMDITAGNDFLSHFILGRDFSFPIDA